MILKMQMEAEQGVDLELISFKHVNTNNDRCNGKNNPKKNTTLDDPKNQLPQKIILSPFVLCKITDLGANLIGSRFLTLATWIDIPSKLKRRIDQAHSLKIMHKNNHKHLIPQTLNLK